MVNAMTDAQPEPTPSVAAGWYPDPSSGQQRWWDGSAWGPHQPPALPGAPVPVAYATATTVKNSFATASLVLGIIGFFVTGIPLFIGFFFGGPLDILAIIFGIIGINRANKVGVGMAASVVGLVLGSLAFIAIFFGAGTIW